MSGQVHGRSRLRGELRVWTAALGRQRPAGPVRGGARPSPLLTARPSAVSGCEPAPRAGAGRGDRQHYRHLHQHADHRRQGRTGQWLGVNKTSMTRSFTATCTSVWTPTASIIVNFSLPHFHRERPTAGWDFHSLLSGDRVTAWPLVRVPGLVTITASDPLKFSHSPSLGDVCCFFCTSTSTPPLAPILRFI